MTHRYLTVLSTVSRAGQNDSNAAVSETFGSLEHDAEYVVFIDEGTEHVATFVHLNNKLISMFLTESSSIPWPRRSDRQENRTRSRAVDGRRRRR
jgi:hypothetical protein